MSLKLVLVRTWLKTDSPRSRRDQKYVLCDLRSVLTLDLAAARANVAASLQSLEIVTQGPVNEKITSIPAGLSQATLNLLTSLRQTVTTLALSFKPPLTAAGINRYLDKATDEVRRLVSCVVAAAAGNGKSVLVEEWKDGIELVGREVERLLSVLEEGVRQGAVNAGNSNDSSSASESPYLAHTGITWDAIDRLKARLPADERSAVTQRWEVQKETVRDAWGEFKEMLEDAEEDADDEDGDDDMDGGFGGMMDDDDEWGELEKAMNATMNATERKRAEAVCTLPKLFPDSIGKTALWPAPDLARHAPALLCAAPARARGAVHCAPARRIRPGRGVRYRRVRLVSQAGRG